MAERTVRQMIRAAQAEMLSGDLLPDRGADLLNQLTSLLGNCNDAVLDTDLVYKQVYLGFLDSEEAASRAKIRAECTAEYRAMREAHNTKELCVEMVRTLKKYLDTKREEMRLTR